MKKLLILFTAVIFFACNSDDKKASQESNKTTQTQHSAKADPAKLTTIEWTNGKEKSLGKVNEGPDIDVTFHYKNTGTNPLVINRVWAGCGCTVPEQPKEPIAPGKEGVIKAVFKTDGRPGFQSKEVFVEANTDPSPTTLRFSVEVIKKG